MTAKFIDRIEAELGEIEAAGLYKRERVISSPQSGRIEADPGGQVLNFCANNYLGLADHPELIETAKAALERYGYGMASVRFICGTQEEHKALEARLRQAEEALRAAAAARREAIFELWDDCAETGEEAVVAAAGTMNGVATMQEVSA